MTSPGKRHIKKLKIKCTFEENGCEWTGEMKLLNSHLRDCEFCLVPCPNKCTAKGTQVMLIKKYISVHMTTTCPHRVVSCPYCSLEVRQCDLESIHLRKCNKVIVSCPNEGCQVKSERDGLQAHLSLCVYGPVPCKYAQIGCRVVTSRKSIESHEDDHRFHLDVAVETISKLNFKNIISAHTFKVSNFEQLKATDAIYYSPPFHTHERGYKLCVRIYANGVQSGHGTHMSVYVHLMQGDYDKYLDWPFTGEVTLELLNQKEDAGHYKKTLVFPKEAENINQRVTDGERCQHGFGYKHFLKHNKCYSNKASYIVNNTAYFRVSIINAVIKTEKPWLTCTL